MLFLRTACNSAGCSFFAYFRVSPTWYFLRLRWYFSYCIWDILNFFASLPKLFLRFLYLVTEKNSNAKAQSAKRCVVSIQYRKREFRYGQEMLFRSGAAANFRCKQTVHLWAAQEERIQLGDGWWQVPHFQEKFRWVAGSESVERAVRIALSARDVHPNAFPADELC